MTCISCPSTFISDDTRQTIWHECATPCRVSIENQTGYVACSQEICNDYVMLTHVSCQLDSIPMCRIRADCSTMSSTYDLDQRLMYWNSYSRESRFWRWILYPHWRSNKDVFNRHTLTRRYDRAYFEVKIRIDVDLVTNTWRDVVGCSRWEVRGSVWRQCLFRRQGSFIYTFCCALSDVRERMCCRHFFYDIGSMTTSTSILTISVEGVVTLDDRLWVVVVDVARASRFRIFVFNVNFVTHNTELATWRFLVFYFIISQSPE